MTGVGQPFLYGVEPRGPSRDANTEETETETQETGRAGDDKPLRARDAKHLCVFGN